MRRRNEVIDVRVLGYHLAREDALQDGKAGGEVAIVWTE